MSSLSDIGKENVIPAKVEDLSEEQKAEMEQKMQELKKAYINSFSMTRQGKVIQKYKCQMPIRRRRIIWCQRRAERR
ncbi:hypothetical protein OsJ_24019 [Oryza sativa Japonica Group]|uniref:Uncharacterized protein n=1 Tax=Oryza sativa subsp. japonica TaxID=39947 RepID=A3BJ47_ORYSJ|nr:hypothetical protein OsJ_24019 [Oryza sativa Japonica Group]